MASPLKHIGDFLFGGSSGGQTMPMIAPPPSTPAPPPPLQSPTGTQTATRPTGGGSFVSSAAPAALPQQIATKSLLGQ